MKSTFLIILLITINSSTSASIKLSKLIPYEHPDKYESLVDRVARVEDLIEFGYGSRGRESIHDIINKYRTVVVYLTLPHRIDLRKIYEKYRNTVLRIRKEDPTSWNHTFYTQHLCSSGPFCEAFDLQTFPSMYIFQDGSLHHVYEGNFEEDHLYKSLKWYAFYGVIQVSTFDDLKNLLVDEIHTIAIAFFRKQKAMNETFHRVARDLQSEELWFAYCSCKKSSDKICKFIKEKKLADHLLLMRSKRLTSRYEPEVQVYKKDSNYTVMRQWLMREQHGILGLRYVWNKKYFQKPLIVFYFNLDFLFKNYTAKYKYWRNRLITVIKPYEKQFTFAISNKNDTFFDDFKDIPIKLPENFEKKESLIVVIHSKTNRRYLLSNYTNTSFITFVNNFHRGLLKQSYIRSESFPVKLPAWTGEEVKVQNISGENFLHLIHRQNFFLYIYTSWCGFCQDFYQQYENLANHFKQIQFYQIDGSKNELIDDVPIYGYPTIYYLRKDLSQPPIRYQGCNMSYKDLLCWAKNVQMQTNLNKIIHEEL